MVGITKPKNSKIQKVIIQFDQEFSPYIKTKPIHPSQINKPTENGLLIAIQVHLNYELENLILSFGEHAKVLEPEILKDRIKKRLTNALNNY